MGNILKIDKDKIIYHAIQYGYHSDVSWNISVDNIKIIGAINRMAGDDDSFFIVFVDHAMKAHIVNTSYLEKGREELFTLLSERFNLDIVYWETKLLDADIVLFPKIHIGKKLYKFDLIHFIKRFTGFVHVASGILNDTLTSYYNKTELLEYIKTSIANHSLKHEIELFASGALMIDVWIKDKMISIQLEDNSVGLSIIEDSFVEFTSIPDERFKDNDSFIKRVINLWDQFNDDVK